MWAMSFASRIRLKLETCVRARLVAWYVLILGGTLGCLGALVFAAQARGLLRELDAGLELRALSFATERRPALLALEMDPIVPTGRPGSAIAVRSAAGTLLFRTGEYPDLMPEGEQAAMGAARQGTEFVTARDRSGSAVRIASVSVERPGAGRLVVQAASPLAPVRQTQWQWALLIAALSLAVLALGSLGGCFIARRALAPVEAIVDRVQRIQGGTGERLDVHGGSEELDRLVATLNDMLERIDGAVRSARRFAADTSHEMQTPLAVMRSAAEACIASRPGGGCDEAACDLLVELDRLSTLVRDLRLLALAEGKQLLEDRREVDLAELLRDCGEIARAVGERKGIEVDVHAPDRGPVVQGSPTHLRRVVLNLAENAVRYSPPLSRVRLSVTRANGHAVFAVADHGCGIAAEDLPHIFEPFYRTDPARARESGGTGLGLAIVDQIVRLHGGHVRVASAPDRGSTFVVYLPAA